MDLVGEFQGSGLDHPTFLLRRGAEMIQVTGLLFALLGLVDSRRTAAEISLSLSQVTGRAITAEQVEYLLDTKIAPLGLLASAPDRRPPPRAQTFQLTMRIPLIPAPVVRFLTFGFQYLFRRPAAVLALAGAVTVDVWLFRDRLFSSAFHDAVRSPRLLVWATAVMLAVALFHEIGHASGCRAGGGRPGRIGAGVYVAFPALYTDVTDSYRLTRRARLGTDVGGVYFELVAVVAMAGAYLRWHWTPLILAIGLDQLTILEQFYPFARFDGYYVMADLAGVPEPFEHLRAALAHLWHVITRRRPLPALDLTRRSRRLLGAWGTFGLLFMPFSLFLLGRATPGIVSSSRQAVLITSASVARSGRAGRPLAAAGEMGLCLLTLLPAAGMAVVYVRLLKRLRPAAAALWRRMRRSRAIPAPPAATTSARAMLVAEPEPEPSGRPPAPSSMTADRAQAGRSRRAVAAATSPKKVPTTPNRTPSGGDVTPTLKTAVRTRGGPATLRKATGARQGAASPPRKAVPARKSPGRTVAPQSSTRRGASADIVVGSLVIVGIVLLATRGREPLSLYGTNLSMVTGTDSI